MTSPPSWRCHSLVCIWVANAVPVVSYRRSSSSSRNVLNRSSGLSTGHSSTPRSVYTESFLTGWGMPSVLQAAAATCSARSGIRTQTALYLCRQADFASAHSKWDLPASVVSWNTTLSLRSRQPPVSRDAIRPRSSPHSSTMSMVQIGLGGPAGPRAASIHTLPPINRAHAATRPCPGSTASCNHRLKHRSPTIGPRFTQDIRHNLRETVPDRCVHH